MYNWRSLNDGSDGAVSTVHGVNVTRDIGEEGTEFVLDFAISKSCVVVLQQLYQPRVFGLLFFNFVCETRGKISHLYQCS